MTKEDIEDGLHRMIADGAKKNARKYDRENLQDEYYTRGIKGYKLTFWNGLFIVIIGAVIGRLFPKHETLIQWYSQIIEALLP